MGYLRTGTFAIYEGATYSQRSVVRWTGDQLLILRDSPESTLDWAADSGGLYPALWVKVVDGWEKDGNWGGYLQSASVTHQGKYIDSKDGWVKAVSSKVDKVRFIDKGDWYEIWQDGTNRPLRIIDSSGYKLRFIAGEPGHFNILDE